MSGIVQVGDLQIAMEPFSTVLNSHEIELARSETTTLQVNVGLTCNQACMHCHLEAGPWRTERMDRETAELVVEYASRGSYQVIDLTGGATELNPVVPDLIEKLSDLTGTLIMRSNLTVLADGRHDELVELCKRHRVVIVASFPSVNAGQTDAQRGSGVLEKSVAALRKLNARGYGCPGSGLELDLVSNPSGAFFPAAQDKLEARLRGDLERKWGIVFSNLFTFANVPLGRFRKWLIEKGNLETYMGKLAAGFNPCTVDQVMCRSLVSISWDGYLYDCDFNQAAGLPLGGEKRHVSDSSGPPAPGTPIAVGDHCFACTAGSGFT